MRGGRATPTVRVCAVGLPPGCWRLADPCEPLRRATVKLNGNRHIKGTLRGFDQFMNLVIDETIEQVSATENNKIGMVVIRGNSIVMMEALEKLWCAVAAPVRPRPAESQRCHGFAASAPVTTRPHPRPGRRCPSRPTLAADDRRVPLWDRHVAWCDALRLRAGRGRTFRGFLTCAR